MIAAAGTRFGPYETLDKIGAGGIGEVWKARDTRLGRIVAIKISKAQFSERFEREARAVAALNHPHICQLYDVGPNYLVMEFIEGAPLKGPLPLAKAIEYAGQILDALDAAHRKGITHRDLKPANILVTKQGIKLLDFGLAHVAPGPGDPTLTQAGTLMGTPAYMAPEQWEGKRADARSDIYAFGCVLHEMLTGKLVAKERTRLEPAVLESVVQTCLEKDPEDRWQSARDIKRALLLPAAIAVELRRVPWIPIAAATILLSALGGGWAVSHFRQPPADERSFRLQIDPPEGGRFVFGINSGGIALSPDGKTAAFVASGNGKTGLWIRPLDSTIVRLLPGTEGASYPFWSPDNKSIAFFTSDKLERVDLAGGSPQPICDVTTGQGGAWSSDGQILLGTFVSGLLQVSASGGTPTPLTSLDASRGEVSHRWPQMLPGGRFLYWVGSDKPENTGAYAASFAKPAERVRLLAADTNALYAPGNDGKSYLFWLRGGTLFAQEFDSDRLKLAGEPRPVAEPVARSEIHGQMNVAASATGLLLYSDSNTSSQFTWLDRAGKSLGVLGELGEYETFRLSPDGHRVAISRDRPGGTDLWLLEAERGVFTRFTSNPGTHSFPIWSPEGRTVVYRSTDARGLFRKESSGAGSEQRLTQWANNQLVTPTDWSRDGRFVLYYAVAPRTQRDLWILPVSPEGGAVPGTQPKPYLRTPFNESWGRFSPQASPRWIAYQSDESGRYEIYIQAFPEPHGATRISTGGGQYPEWNPDGRELFYVSPDYKLMSVRLKLGADSIQPSAPRELFPLPATEIGWSPYDASPDGQRFLVRVTSQQAAKPLTVIVNWPALLKK